MKTSYYIFIIFLLTGCINEDEKVSLVKHKGKFGFIDTKGNWYIKPKFDSLGIFYNGFADSYLNEKVGKIDSKGNLIINHNFDFIGHFENNLALIMINDSINYINLKGELISKLNFFDGEDFCCGLAPIQLIKDGKWGYINSLGENVIDFRFDYAGEFKDSIASVDIAKNEYKIDITGQIIDSIEIFHKERKFSLIGVSDLNTLGRINNQGDTIMPMIHKSFGYLQNDKFWFNTGSFYGLADTTGRILSNLKYEYLSYFSDNGIALAKLNGKYGYINDKCQEIIDFKFQDAKGFKHGLAAVKQNDKWGFINRQGDFIIEAIYNNVYHQFRPVMAKYESMYDFDYE